MSTFSVNQLRQLVQARRLPLSKYLGVLPQEVVDRLIDFYHKNADQNVISESVENRQKRNIPMGYSDYINNSYSQIPIQKLKDGGDGKNRLDYSDPIFKEAVDAIQSIVGPAQRMRIAGLKVGAEIPEHIDDPDQFRVIALLHGTHRFLLRAKGKNSAIDMQVGELWYINTAWPHRVLNAGDSERLALLVDVSDGETIGINTYAGCTS